MSLISRTLLTVFVLAVLVPAAGFSQETPEQALARAAELQKAADEAAAQKATAEQGVAGVEAKLLELQQMVLKLQRELQQAQAKVKDAETALPKRSLRQESAPS